MKEQILQDLQSAIDKAQGLMKEIKEVKLEPKEYPNGTVLRHGDGALIYKAVKDSGYGFWDKDDWTHCYNWTSESRSEYWQPEPIEVWIEALKKEAGKRGIKEGVKINRDWMITSPKEVVLETAGKGFEYDARTDNLFLNGKGIYQVGKWATVVEEKFISCTFKTDNLRTVINSLTKDQITRIEAIFGGIDEVGDSYDEINQLKAENAKLKDLLKEWREAYNNITFNAALRKKIALKL